MREGKNTVDVEALVNPQEGLDDAAIETAIGIGSDLKIGNITIPPPCTGSICLLELIDSPFISGKQDCSFLEIVASIYVLCKREKAVEGLYRIARTQKVLNSTSELAKQSDLHYAKYLNALEANSAGWSDFDKKVMAFSDELGTFDLAGAVVELRNYINHCFSIFRHVPNQLMPDESKKKADTILNG